MSKINTITLSNFKFFGKEETINIDGKHLLLYGENGSGKSSLFWGIYTLLEASFKKSVETDKYFQPFGSNEESLVNIVSAGNLLSAVFFKIFNIFSYCKYEFK